MPETFLSDISDIGSFSDDYDRAGVKTAEQLALLTVSDILMLGIGGLKEARATKHLAAAKAALETPMPEATPAAVAAPAPAPAKAKPVAAPAPAARLLRDHPAMSFLDDKAADKVTRFANACDRVVDQWEWLDHVYKRALLTGRPEAYLDRFARNLSLRLV